MARALIKVAQLKSVTDFRQRLRELELELPVDEQCLSASEGSPLAQPAAFGRYTVANRWCIHPMEGWDAQRNGSPSELTVRRWANFGRSGAKLIWGGEAASVRADGRDSPRQLLAIPSTADGLFQLRQTLVRHHQQACGSQDGLVVGLQLTHSGRFSRSSDNKPAPRVAYHHPLLDTRVGISEKDDAVVWTDDQLQTLIDDYVVSARLAADAGFHFVDVKACHGYLLHEFLSARTRTGPYGGDYAGRTRLLKEIVTRIRQEVPSLEVGVRLSVFDTVPFGHVADGTRPVEHQHLLPYIYGFGVSEENPCVADFTEPLRLIDELQQLGTAAINVTCGSPYYNPHMQRPAAFPPTDGYPPPEDPLVGVVRQIQTTRQCKLSAPLVPLVGSGYSYLQEYLVPVAQAVVRAGWVDFVGIGRGVLSYPTLPLDTLLGRQVQKKRLCRTFSDCTTAPRQGLVSGCYPLDSFYKDLPDAEQLQVAKQAKKKRSP